MYLWLYCKGSKRLFKVLWWEGVGNRTELQYIDPPLWWPSALCLSRSPGLLNWRPGSSAFYWVLAFSTTSCHQRVSKTTGGPEGPFGREWLSLPHLSATSLDSNSSGAPSPFGLVWLSLPHLVSNSVRSLTVWILVLAELYNSSTSIQSLEWHVWSSSSRNNCHAVQRSLSFGASVYECIMGFTLSHFISQIRHWNVSLPSGASLWNGMFARAEGQNIIIAMLETI